jgi:hypothetical protein
MKKFLFLMMVAGSLVACNNSADTAGDTKDSLDSVANAKKDMIDSSAEQRKDVIDSTTEAKKEVVEKLDTLNRRDTTNK